MNGRIAHSPTSQKQSHQHTSSQLDMEINQGRAAMLGIFGAMLQEGLQGQTLAEHIASGGKILIPGLF